MQELKENTNRDGLWIEGENDTSNFGDPLLKKEKKNR
jgi:hypothetical protein